MLQAKGPRTSHCDPRTSHCNLFRPRVTMPPSVLQHANAAILELLDTVSQPDAALHAAGIPKAAPRKYAARPAAPQPWQYRFAVSQHTAALCGRLAQRRDGDGPTAGQENPVSPPRRRSQPTASKAHGNSEPGFSGKRDPFGSSNRVAADRQPDLHAAAGFSSDGEASSAAEVPLPADLDADMLRVRQLVDDICGDLERDSPVRQPRALSEEPQEVRQSNWMQRWRHTAGVVGTCVVGDDCLSLQVLRSNADIG